MDECEVKAGFPLTLPAGTSATPLPWEKSETKECGDVGHEGSDDDRSWVVRATDTDGRSSSTWVFGKVSTADAGCSLPLIMLPLKLLSAFNNCRCGLGLNLTFITEVQLQLRLQYNSTVCSIARTGRSSTRNTSI